MKRFYLLLIAFISLLVLPVYAMPSAEADNTLNVNKDYNDTAVFAGNNITVNSNINGLGLYAGQSVSVKGGADYGFAAGNSVDVIDYKTKDLFVAGQVITIKDTDVRNIYAAAATVTITGDAGDVFVAGEKVTLTGNYNNVYVEADEITLDGSISGKLYINEDAKQTIKDGSKIATTETYKNPEVEKQDVDYKNLTFKLVVNTIIRKILSTIRHFVNVLILGFLTILIFKNVVTRINDASESAGSIFGHFGIGFALLIFVPILALILLFTGLVSGLGFVLFMLYILGIYLSGIVGSLYLGKLVFKKMNAYLRFFLMTLILTVIYIIPVVGGLAEFFMLCFSLGLMGHICLPETKKGK